jgi:hypothetical protein
MIISNSFFSYFIQVKISIHTNIKDVIFDVLITVALLTAWSGVTEKLLVSYLLRKLLLFKGNPAFITVFTSDHCLYLSRAR